MTADAGKHNTAAIQNETVCHIATLLDALECGAYVLDRTGRIIHANSRLCDMAQRPREGIVGKFLQDAYPPGPDRKAVEDELQHFGDSGQRATYLPRADGQLVPVIVSGRRLDLEGLPGKFRVVTVIDIQSQKRVEEELQERAADIAALSDTVLEQALALKRQNEKLEERVQVRTAELHKANMEAIYMLAVASEAKDADTGAHVRRIEHYTRLLARELGMSDDEARRMGYSAILHDVGKIHVPDDILRKPAALSDDEWVVMRQHTLAGERILSRESFFDAARSIARSHHENWDGSGYPDGLAAGAIPQAARIVHVADVYDALISERPYKKPWTPAEAEAAIGRDSGRFFDPEVVTVFLKLLREGRLGLSRAG